MTESIKIEVDYDNSEFTPGDPISGTVSWLPTEGTETIALRLFWFTSGRGTQDVELLEELTWPASQGTADFSFELPNEPYSFSGKLISLTWALEAVKLPEETSVRREFTLTPNGREIILSPVDNPVTGDKKKKWFKTQR